MNISSGPVASAIIAVIIAVTSSSCAINTPFRGPGYDRNQGVTLADAGDKVIVVLTHATLSESRRNFDSEVGIVADSLAVRDGLIGYSLRKELLGNEAWTMTVWRDEAALAAFVASNAHQNAIVNSAHELAAVRFKRFEVDVSELPITWEQALAKLEADISIETY